MRLPQPRGPVSTVLVEHLTGPASHGIPHTEGAAALAAAARVGRPTDDVLADEDLQLALALCYELHYRGIDDVDERWEWEPSLIGLRGQLESRFEAGLAEHVSSRGTCVPGRVAAAGLRIDFRVDQEIRRRVDADDGPSLSAYVAQRASLEQVRDFAVHRSIYQLKEADPHTWGIPRLAGQAKAALVEIQFDEYGEGRAERMHATLFASTLRALDLDDSYGAYLGVVPARTLATVNLISLFGLHRRWRGALLGHLAVFEMTSAVPNRRYGDGLRRLGLGRDATAFFDEHVAADAVHEQIAVVDLCGSFVAAEPERAADVLFGVDCCLLVEAAFAASLIEAWQRDTPSLHAPVPGNAVPV